MLLLAIVMPRGGGWTIDDGVKRIAAEQGRGPWAEIIPDGPMRAAALNDPAAFAPLDPPFAYRVPGGFAFGFSPFTRAFFRILARHEMMMRIAMALAVILLWALMEGAALSLAFLLLPLTFYGLVPWEHGLSWLLMWPAIWVTLVHDEVFNVRFALAASLGALAVLLRPEAILLVAALAIYLLVRRNFRGAFAFAGTGVLTFIVLIMCHTATAQEPWWVQFSLNLGNQINIVEWISTRPGAFYGLIFMMDREPLISAGVLALFVAGIALVFRSEARQNRIICGIGLFLLALWIIYYQYRLWSFPLPPVALLGANSLLATLPWVVVLTRPPYRQRPALILAVGMITLAILISPVWLGVHWGPRILLFTLPLLVLDLYQTRRARGWLFSTLLVLTIVQTISSAAMAYARNSELSQRTKLASPKLGSVVICPTTSQCADLAPLWTGREFFTAATPRELKQLLIEFRRSGLDTCWLHLSARDPLYAAAFPESKPVRPYRMTILRSSSFYRTEWRILELVVNAKDTLWAPILQAEAGTLLKEGYAREAHDLQHEAMHLSPESAQSHHNMALIYFALGEKNEARAEVQRALELDSTLTEARRLREDLFRRSEETPAAGEHPPDWGRGQLPD